MLYPSLSELAQTPFRLGHLRRKKRLKSLLQTIASISSFVVTPSGVFRIPPEGVTTNNCLNFFVRSDDFSRLRDND